MILACLLICQTCMRGLWNTARQLEQGGGLGVKGGSGGQAGPRFARRLARQSAIPQSSQPPSCFLMNMMSIDGLFVAFLLTRGKPGLTGRAPILIPQVLGCLA